MRIALISFHRGGMAHYAAMLARSLLWEANDLELACFVCSDFPPDYLPEAATVYRYPLPHSIRPAEWTHWVRAPRIWQQCLRDLRAWKADVWHFNSGHPWYGPLIRGLHHESPLIYTMHDVRPHPGEWHFQKRFKTGPLLKHADCIILHSEPMRAEAMIRHQLSPERTAVIPCGLLSLPAPPSVGVKERPHQLLLPGRIYAYKGFDVLLEALPRIAAAVPSVRVVIAGEGNFAPWMALQQRHRDRVRLINRYLSESELSGLLLESALIVLPYREASQSGMALLAASFGKPVVASRVGAIPDVIEDGVTGMLVEPGRPDALAESIVPLLRDPERRRSMGKAARRLNETRYGPAPIGRALRSLYGEVLQRHAHS